MASFKLTYFDFHGGRGKPTRLALPAANRWRFVIWPLRMLNVSAFGVKADIPIRFADVG